jgi:hypothetical protein
MICRTSSGTPITFKSFKMNKKIVRFESRRGPKIFILKKNVLKVGKLIFILAIFSLLLFLYI